LSLEPHLVGGEHCLDVVGQRRHPGQALGREIGAGDDRFHLRMRLRGRDVDADDPRVRHRGPQYGEMQHARELDVVDVLAEAPDEPGILLAEHPAVTERLLVVVDKGFGWAGRRGGHAGLPAVSGCAPSG
jgi:hypothetical protein